MIALTGWDTTASGFNKRQVVRILRTGAAPGSVARRSRVVVSGPVAGPALAGASLSRNGASFYLCSVSATRTERTTKVASYRTATGHLRTVLATYRVPGPTFPQQGLGCPLALDTTGSFLLVPTAIRYPANPAASPVIRLARINVATKASALLSFPMFSTSGMDEAISIHIAW